MTNFYPVGDGRWNEWYPSRAAQGARQAGTTLVDDKPPQPGELERLDDSKSRSMRSRYRLECRKCGGRAAVVAREASLFAAMNGLAGHGVSHISLTGLAARLRRIPT